MFACVCICVGAVNVHGHMITEHLSFTPRFSVTTSFATSAEFGGLKAVYTASYAACEFHESSNVQKMLDATPHE